MKNKILWPILIICLLSLAATNIKFFTDYPNSQPVDSDFFVYQRNQSYGNASGAQLRTYLFTSPSFTGSGYIPGQWHVGSGGIWNEGTYYGNGAGITNVPGISGNFFAATNGIGQNPTFYGGGTFNGVYFFTEIDAQNFFPTNLFTGKTNAVLLSTDGNGQLQPTDFTAATNNDKVISVNQTNNDIALSNNLTAALSAALVSPTNKFSGDGSGLTNLTYKYTTNIVGAANFVFGKAYWTNITGNFTFPALTMQDAAAMETLSVWVTNSGASTFTATINGVAGAPGKVIPAVFYCTNASVTEIDVSHFGVLWTNACVSRN